jgi:serine protease Do
VPAPADKVVFDIERKARSEEDSEKAEPAKTAINDFGLEVQPLTAELAKPLGLPASTKGLVVSSVKEGSPAAEAGIQEGDVITKLVRNRRIQAVTSVEDFQGLASQADELAVVVQSGKLSRFVTLSKNAK